MNLRDAARDKPCQVRIPGVCNGRTDTTVLAHIGIAGTRGMGQKGIDLAATFSCSSCHDVIDSRCPPPDGLTKETIRGYAMDGVLRTLTYLSTAGEWSLNRGVLGWCPHRWG